MINVNNSVFGALCAKGVDYNEFLIYFNQYAAQYTVITPLDAANFWGQALFETSGLQWLTELWGPTDQQLEYEPPGKLAPELGNTQPGDGYLFRGRGLFSTTGRGNYLTLSKKLNIPMIMDKPSLVSTPEVAVLSALEFWRDHKLSILADQDLETQLSRRVNGGTNGLAQRLAFVHKCKDIFT